MWELLVLAGNGVSAALLCLAPVLTQSGGLSVAQTYAPALSPHGLQGADHPWQDRENE